MLLRDFLIFAAVCALWALNTVLSKIVVSDWQVPPLLFGAARFLVVAIAVSPWLLPAPKPVWKVAFVGLCMGGGTFALSFIGLRDATPSSSAIVWQLSLPITTLLSVLVLGEKIHWRRGVGIALAFAGVVTVMWRPNDMELSRGLLWIAASAVAGSVGAVMLKKTENVRPLQFQAWVGVSSVLPLAVLSPILEPNGVEAVRAVLWPFVGMVLFSGLVVSVIGHTVYYSMLQRYEANLIAPLSLMVPLFTMGLGVVITNDHIDLQMGSGAAVALAGVLILALRTRRASA